MAYNKVEVLVLGGANTGKATLTREITRSGIDLSEEKVEIDFDIAATSFLPSNYYKYNVILILCALNDIETIKLALALASDIDIPKIIIATKADLPRAQSFDRISKRAHELAAPYFEISNEVHPDYKTVLNLILSEHKKREQERNKRCKIRMNRKTIQLLQVIAMTMSVLCMIDGLAIIMIASIEFIKERTVWPSQTIFDSMIIAGMVTFVISFIGFYGSKKAGIKEYLKAFYLIMIGVCVYKIVVLVIYAYYAQPDSTLSDITIPFLSVAIVIDSLTIFFIFLFMNAVTKIENINHYSDDPQSIPIFK